MAKKHFFSIGATCAALALVLTGCGGSGSGTTVSTEAVYSVDDGDSVVRQTFPFGTAVTLFGSLDISHMKVSPDGSKVLYARAGILTVANIDGTGSTTIVGYKMADWNADGSKIYAVSVTNSVRLMNPDGTGVSSEIYNGNSGGGMLSFDVNRTGTKIAFTGAFSGWARVYTINVDGSGQAALTVDNENAANVRWNQDGTLLVYERAGDIWTVDASGSGAVNITSSAETESQASFRTDGSIVFVRDGDLWTMQADGTGQVEIYNGTNPQSWPDSN